MTDPLTSQTPASVLGARVAVDAAGPLPKVDDLGLSYAKAQAFDWQRQRSHAKWNDMAGTLTGRPGARWVLETHAIVGVVGEQVLLAIELEVEKTIVKAAIDRLPDADFKHKPSVAAHYARSLRFFAEGQSNAIVIALHGLANLGVRTLEFDSDISTDDLRKLGMSRTDFAPGSLSRRSWVSWTQKLVDSVITGASARSVPVQEFAAKLGLLAGEQAIIDLLDLRNTQYHRWRGESAGVTGIAFGELPAADILASGQAVDFGGELLPPYSQGQDTLDDVVVTGRQALDAFVLHMEPLLETWGKTLPRA
ncbi:hypothetical protein GL325_06350 [Aeromicrobium sp. 636]|uniref:Uncharacterized protein n=1 Tax=Aeromicrobium senzhongii TaxID=2663859 RepID=A0A8I0EUM9_9ACTN|nr:MULTISPECIES: hypothetical protein [Aeromicrobium]MBC9225933.1 hypothetical protein [Aeromicrobium senzhongii]MCQ3998040.1 hypothetical protein [Aeromicrobium sp. 636]